MAILHALQIKLVSVFAVIVVVVVVGIYFRLFCRRRFQLLLVLFSLIVRTLCVRKMFACNLNCLRSLVFLFLRINKCALFTVVVIRSATRSCALSRTYHMMLTTSLVIAHMIFVFNVTELTRPTRIDRRTTCDWLLCEQLATLLSVKM